MATALDEEDIDQGQDDREAAVPVPQVQVAAPVQVAPPGQAPIVPPANTFQERLERVRMLGNAQNVDEAEKAVATAMKYQAIRGYQRDLANGVPASDALAKWAPTMFAGPKQATLGQAASLVRATRPNPEKYMDIGGVGYQMQGGKATPLTPPKAIKPRTFPMVVPVDPNNPDAGHVTLQLDPDDPLVKQGLARARQGPVVAPPEPPGVLSRVGAGAVAGVKGLFSGGGPPPPVTTPAPAPPSAQSPVTAPAAAPSPMRTAKPTTPEQKVAAAKALRQQHPDWTKKQILEAVNQ